MKYAITGPRGRINQIVETQNEDGSLLEITDEQAALVEAGKADRKFYLLIGGELFDAAIYRQSHRFNPETGEWVAIPPVVPAVISPRQIRLALIDRGIMPEQITAMLSQIEDVAIREKALTEWEYALDVKRSHPLVAQLSGVLQFTDEDVDALFIEAAKL